MTRTKWVCEESLTWLKKILFERFGISFRLHILSNGRLELDFPNSDGAISFATDKANYFTSSNSDLPCCTWNGAIEGWRLPLCKSLPAPGASSLKYPLIQKMIDGFYINYDVLGVIYWILSRQEEVGRTDLDSHGRFPSTSSHAYKYNYVERPIVDEWLNILGQVIVCQWPKLILKQHRFVMKVSHDVDSPSRYGFASPKRIIRSVAGELVKRRSIKNAIRIPLIRLNSHKRLHTNDPHNTFDWIMDVSEKYGLTSAFYFMCGRTDPTKDADYELEHPAIRDLINRIHQRGHEIGVHPSYSTYQQPSLIALEAERLTNLCRKEGIPKSQWGARMHFLRWEHPVTLQALELAGIAYDATLGFADRPGFRCGTCFDYPAFNPVSQKILNIRIRPLIVMECTIIAARYLGLGVSEAAYKQFSQLKRTCKQMNGCFTLLWHNSEFQSQEKKDLYQSLLEQESEDEH